MDTPRKLMSTIFCFLLLLLLSGDYVQGSSHHHHKHHSRHLFYFKPSKLFVFGDSYADTGNNMKAFASSWKQPYGITFPGKPAGRFSDGRVLTDFIARFLGLKSPTPYRWRKYAVNRLRYGMNFAYGGTGVFNTMVPEPNMTTQIDFFQQMIQEKVYASLDLQSSVALVTVAGNDYSTYIARNGSLEGMPAFITQVSSQLGKNLKRIHELGVRKVAVGALQPLGCLPRSTVISWYQQCNDTENQLVDMHNLLLRETVEGFNNGTKDSPFVFVDIYSAFLTVFKNKGITPGSTMFENPLKPCCRGISTGDSCGSVDANGTKLYTLCDKRESTFFWDNVHPTQEGWRAVYYALQDNLKQL